MSTGERFAELLQHMEWADAAVWRAVLESEAARVDPATLGRLQHLHLVQRAFLSVWRDEPVDRRAGESLDAEALAAWAQGYYGEALAWIRSAGEATLDGQARVPWNREVAQHLGFEPAATTIAETLQQVVLHTAHHRGQVTARLRELGAAPPLVDYIAWLWQGRPSPHWP